MSEQARTDFDEPVEISVLSENRKRKILFDSVYNGNPSLDLSNNLFNKSTREFDAKEQVIYSSYYNALYDYELDLVQRAELELKRAKIESDKIKHKQERKLKDAQTKFYNIFGNKVDETLLVFIADALGQLLYDIVDNNLDDRKKEEIVKIVCDLCEGDRKSRDILLKFLRLSYIYNKQPRIPIGSNQVPIPPSGMSGTIQTAAAINDMNFIFPYPFEILNHFPVIFCHSAFADFLDILNDNDKNRVVGEFKNYLKTEPNIKKKLDTCISQLIKSMLSYKEGEEKEKYLVEKVAAAIRLLFPPSQVKENMEITTGIANLSPKIAIDASVTIGEFPFILFEAKNASYSINAVLQALQYYGITESEFIDNDPCFLITFDRGLMYVYGAAKVNLRIVCSCLLSLEFTNYFYNIRNFTDTLFKCLGSLVFFFNKFSARISGRSDDPIHNKYSFIKSAHSKHNQPFPAIFSVKKLINSEARVDISFEESFGELSLKPGVYKVKTLEGQPAILKLACNYDIEVHKDLSDKNLAPRILGYEVLCSNFHLVLMEYFDIAVYDNIFNFFYNRNDPVNEINQESLCNSLKGLLSELKRLNIVHGDFRSNNIIAKRSIADPKILDDFKLVDFEYSGKVDDPYPCLATKNPGIIWPTSFNSYEPRKFEHDEFMLQQMIETHFMGRTRNQI